MLCLSLILNMRHSERMRSWSEIGSLSGAAILVRTRYSFIASVSNLFTELSQKCLKSLYAQHATAVY